MKKTVDFAHVQHLTLVFIIMANCPFEKCSCVHLFEAEGM